jgi:hypothetical protein
MTVALLDVKSEGVEAMVADCALGGGAIEAEMGHHVVGNPGERLEVLAGSDANGVFAIVAGNHRNVVIGILL